MRILVVAEHDQTSIRIGSLSALAFAQSVAETTEGSVSLLLLGHRLEAAASVAAGYAPTYVADSAGLAFPLADRWSTVIARVVQEQDFDLLVAAAGTFGRDVVTRAGGLLAGAMASEVIGHQFQDGKLLLRRPMYAGAVTATVALSGQPQIVTVRPTAYEPAQPNGSTHPITLVKVDDNDLPQHIESEGLAANESKRPDVSEARVVVSGGRALRNSDDFERIVGGLADALHGATGSSRALVDAGITRNALQVGQTGKVVAPDLYVAVGLSGAVQHLAGMKNSKVIVAINNDPDAPIFEVADYGLLGDVYEVVPELIERLNGS